MYTLGFAAAITMLFNPYEFIFVFHSHSLGISACVSSQSKSATLLWLIGASPNLNVSEAKVVV